MHFSTIRILYVYGMQPNKIQILSSHLISTLIWHSGLGIHYITCFQSRSIYFWIIFLFHKHKNVYLPSHVAGSEAVELPEFLSMVANQMKDTDTEEDCLEAFRMFDKDGSGFITDTDLIHVMANIDEKLTKEEVDEMIQHVRVDETGRISYEGTRFLHSKCTCL